MQFNADKAEASNNREHRYHCRQTCISKDMLQSLSFLMILRMYKRKRAGVRDLSHLGASRSQWLRVGSPVMFNRSPGEKKKEEKSFSSPVFAEILEERHLCEEALAKQNSSGGHQHLIHSRS